MGSRLLCSNPFARCVARYSESSCTRRALRFLRAVRHALLSARRLNQCFLSFAVRFSAAAFLVICAGGAAAQNMASERVLDTFEVGDNVFVRALYVEKSDHVEKSSNTLWVGTSVGVHEIDLATQMPRNTFTRKHGLANEYVFAVNVDSQGYKWFGTNAGGASRYKDGLWKTYFPLHGLADYWVYSFANDLQGDVWIGTWYGVNHFDVESQKLTTYVKELVNEWVYGIAVDAQGRVWFGTEGGVSMFDNRRSDAQQKWRAWTHQDGLGAPNAEGLASSPNTGLGTRSRHDLAIQMGSGASYNPSYVFALLAAPDNTIWAGTWGGGAAQFDGKAWKNFTRKDGLAGNIVFSIASDAKGVLWFGTDNGVSRYDGKTWRNFRQQDGLLSNSIYAVAVTPNGDVWAGSRRGVTRIGQGSPSKPSQ